MSEEPQENPKLKMDKNLIYQKIMQGSVLIF